MCGRTTLTITPDELQRTFGLPVPAGYRPRYNLAPSQDLLAIRDSEAGRSFATLRWGLVPYWSTSASLGNRLINARAETVATKGAFREAFERRRCLIVVDGYYEWRSGAGGKRAYRIRRRGSRPFLLAGLWERWERGEHPLETCTIITTSANETTRAIHDRMPVILGGADRERWLARGSPGGTLKGLLRPYPYDDLVPYEVSTLVNSPANDSPECILPVEAPLTLL